MISEAIHKPVKKIMVGMSGGVDSSVAALCLQQQGFEVEGFFMKNWEEDDEDNFCPARVEMAFAQKVCDQLKIPLHLDNFSREYWDSVFDTFLNELKKGRTPNPDILCNREIKFKAFLNRALELGADAIATGHYANRGEDANGQATLLRGLDRNKDQTYFLHALNQQQIQHAYFPIGGLEKSEVRRIAHEQGFDNHDKKDSTGICFIGERRFRSFLQNYLPAKAGDIVDEEGNTLGQHQGVMFYTIGQRKGLGIGGVRGKPQAAWFVADKDVTNNQLVVAQGNDHPALQHRYLEASQCTWIGELPAMDAPLTAKVRYRQEDQSCRLLNYHGGDGTISVEFNQPQTAITPGQSIVFYQGERCLGGAVIDRSKH